LKGILVGARIISDWQDIEGFEVLGVKDS